MLIASIAPIGFTAFQPVSALTVSVAINNGATFTNTTSVTLTLSADTPENVSEIRFSNDNVVWSDWENYASTKNWTLTADEDRKTVYVNFQDITTQIVSANANITLDLTAPVPYLVLDFISYENRNVSFDASYSIDNYGIANFTWDFGDGSQGSGVTTTHSYANTGNYTGSLTVKDVAGNTATTFFVVRIPAETEPTPTAIPTTAPTDISNPTATPYSSAPPPATPPVENSGLTAIAIILAFAVVAIVLIVIAIVLAMKRRKAKV